MIGLLATVRIKPGVAAEFEADFVSWAAVVKEKEPGTLLYKLTRSKDEPEVYHVFELYTDQAAVDTHLKNYMARPAGPELIAGPPELKLLDVIG